MSLDLRSFEITKGYENIKFDSLWQSQEERDQVSMLAYNSDLSQVWEDLKNNVGNFYDHGNLKLTVIKDDFGSLIRLVLTPSWLEVYNSPNRVLVKDGGLYKIKKDGTFVQRSSKECEEETQKREKIIPEVVNFLEDNLLKLGFQDFQIKLYGSVIDRSCNKSSDIDIALVIDQMVSRETVNILEEMLKSKFGNICYIQIRKFSNEEWQIKSQQSL